MDFRDPTEGMSRRERLRGSPVYRRRVLQAGGGVGVALLAGCTTGGDVDGGSGSGGSGDGDGTTGGASTGGGSGRFRLLISDQPVAIDEFDSLDVSFDEARIFRGEGDDEEETGEGETEDGTETETTEEVTETEEPTEDGAEEENDEPGDPDDQRGFVVLDLDGATVDLTQVVGEKAIGVFDGELQEGRYSKIELYAADVDGVVDGDSVDVKIPSEKLQIVRPFEVVADEELQFVFDINVVRRGPNGGYNLLPVIGESGVVGTDVDVEEVDTVDEGETGTEDGETESGDENETED